MAQTAPIAMIGLNALGAARALSEAAQGEKLQQRKSRLELARRRREEAESLQRGLARQAVVSGALGVAPGSGSMMRQALAASRRSARQLTLTRDRLALDGAGAALGFRRKRAASLLGFGGQLVRQARDLADG